MTSHRNGFCSPQTVDEVMEEVRKYHRVLRTPPPSHANGPLVHAALIDGSEAMLLSFVLSVKSSADPRIVELAERESNDFWDACEAMSVRYHGFMTPFAQYVRCYAEAHGISSLRARAMRLLNTSTRAVTEAGASTSV